MIFKEIGNRENVEVICLYLHNNIFYYIFKVIVNITAIFAVNCERAVPTLSRKSSNGMKYKSLIVLHKEKSGNGHTYP